MAIVAKYNLNSNSNDSVGAFNGSDSNITYVLGKQNGAASFNGTNSQINFGNNTNLNRGTGDFSFAFLSKFNSLGIYGRIFNKYFNTPLNNGYTMGMGSAISSAGRIRTYDGATSDQQTGTGYLETGKWNYYVVTRESGTFRLYKDGSIFTTSAAKTARNMNNSYNFVVGAYASTGRMNGAMSDLEAHNTAVPASFVKNKYAFLYGFM